MADEEQAEPRGPTYHELTKDVGGDFSNAVQNTEPVLKALSPKGREQG